MSNGINHDRRGAPLKRLNPFEAFCAMFWGDSSTTPKRDGGVLGSYRPMPFAFAFISVAILFIFFMFYLTGKAMVDSGATDSHFPYHFSQK